MKKFECRNCKYYRFKSAGGGSVEWCDYNYNDDGLWDGWCEREPDEDEMDDRDGGER